MRRRTLTSLSVLVPGVVVGLLALPALTGVASGAAAPSSFSISGSGWGHGVGMSQVGAYGQAAEGRSVEQILRHYFTGSTVAAYRDDMNVRVNLAYQTSKVRMRVEALSSSPVALEATAGARSVKVGPKDVLELVTNGSAVVVKKNGVVALSAGKVSIRWSGTRWSGATGKSPAVLNLVKDNASFTSSGHRYRYGAVEAVARKAGTKTTLSVNTVVRVHDEYLLGIGEMPSSWPAAALQAQVVASRGYALAKYRQGIRSGCDCHVFATTADQVFVGWSKQAGASGSRWTAAVRATNVSSTKSKTVLVKGVPAQTFFFSSTGGRTQNSEDVWSAKLSYLRSVDDKWSKNPKYNSNAAWGPRVRSQAEVAKAFGLPDVARLDLTDRYASGAVRNAKAISTKGKVATITGVTLVNRLSLTSRWFWPTGQPSGLMPDPNRFTVSFATVPPANQNSTSVIKGRIVPAAPAAGRLASIKVWNTSTRSWSYVTAIKVRADGSFSFPVRPSVKGKVEYLVYKPAESCGRGCKKWSGMASVALNVGPKFWVMPDVSTKQKANAKVALAGTVSPASHSKGSSVAVKRYYSSSKKWIEVAKATIDSKGRFALALKPLPKGNVSLRIDKGATGCTPTACTIGAGSSKVITLSVR